MSGEETVVELSGSYLAMQNPVNESVAVPMPWKAESVVYSNPPATDDSANIFLWGAALAVGAAGIVVAKKKMKMHK